MLMSYIHVWRPKWHHEFANTLIKVMNNNDIKTLRIFETSKLFKFGATTVKIVKI